MSADSKIKKLVKAAIGDNGFVNFVAGLGTLRDKSASAQYMPAKRKSVNELNNVYHSDWVAQRVINKPAQDAIRAGWYYAKLTPKQNQAVINSAKKLKLRKKLLKAMVLARLHGWSYILIGSIDSDNLEDELDIGMGELSFLTVLKREKLKPKIEGGYLSAVVTAGDYDQPEFYQLGDGSNPKYIHHTRVIRIDAPDLVGGDDGLPMPVLQNIYEALVRHTSIQANAGSLVYEAKVDVIKIQELNDNLSFAPFATARKLMERFTSLATMKGNNGMMVLDATDEYESKSYSFGGLADMMREFATQAAGAAEMPRSLLFGESPSGLAATGDFEMRSYYDSVSTMQENVLREPLEYLLSLMMQSLGIAVEDIGLIFESLWQLDAKTKSEVERNNAERDSIYLDLAIITEGQVARQLVDDGTYTTITDEHIKLLDEIAGQTDELEDELSIT